MILPKTEDSICDKGEGILITFTIGISAPNPITRHCSIRSLFLFLFPSLSKKRIKGSSLFLWTINLLINSVCPYILARKLVFPKSPKSYVFPRFSSVVRIIHMNRTELNLFNIKYKYTQHRPDLFKFSSPPFMCVFHHP